jgi:hypothetical protein
MKLDYGFGLGEFKFNTLYEKGVKTPLGVKY